MNQLVEHQSTSNPFLAMCAGFINFSQATGTRKAIRIATLGPEGTSSEYAARHFLHSVAAAGGTCHLYASYEAAAASVVTDENDLVIVANAYGHINELYISNTLRLTTFFVLDTPAYGLAVRPGTRLESGGPPVAVATHPAPAHFVPWFVQGMGVTPDLRLVSSTSEAARLVASGAMDACVTNDEARTRYGLTFCSRTRPIQMLWSVFKKDGNAHFPTLAS